ncbi:hypothetical protein [Aquimarina algiphila]|uniref:hypothetical protein n=1 Tax=Aquimarina algiphila TaxID=2047982 RepID=UPI00232B3613|nr:hypothetical protein [Aquimarina algiphila]
MKNYLKMIPVVAGLALATLGSVNEANASASFEEAPVFGYCAPGGSCGTTSEGTQLNGHWHEDSISDAIR